MISTNQKTLEYLRNNLPRCMQTAAYTLVKRFGVKDLIFRRASFELAANMTQKGESNFSPSCDEVNLANATILENVRILRIRL